MHIEHQEYFSDLQLDCSNTIGENLERPNLVQQYVYFIV